ncbi:MAG: hypothetical protein ACOC41_07235 [Chitinivibrionales bacterium]
MTANANVKIILKSSKEVFSLGQPIELVVTYKNGGNSPVTLGDPAKTWEVMLTVNDLSDSLEHRLPFGKIFTETDEFGITSEFREPADDVIIEADEEYSFIPSTYAQHMNIFAPGLYILTVTDRTDDTVTKVSNDVNITIKAEQSSFHLLLSICTDEKQSIDNREFAVFWLRQYFPEFSYTVANPTSEQIALNQKAITGAKEWWDENRDSKEIEKRILFINTTAGVVEQSD